MQGISDMELEYINAERLEDRAETWDYLGQRISLSNEEKYKFYHENCDLLNNFNLIAAV